MVSDPLENKDSGLRPLMHNIHILFWMPGILSFALRVTKPLEGFAFCWHFMSSINMPRQWHASWKIAVAIGIVVTYIWFKKSFYIPEGPWVWPDANIKLETLFWFEAMVVQPNKVQDAVASLNSAQLRYGSCLARRAHVLAHSSKFKARPSPEH